jgi:Ca2+-binding EF-hand superfamily protein
LRELFHSIDSDGSGTITVNELKEALKAKGQQIPEADIQNLVSGSVRGLAQEMCEVAGTPACS